MSRTAADIPRESMLRMALRWWWVMPCCIAVSFVLAKAYVAKTKPVYQSSARIYVQQNRPHILADNPFAIQQSGTYLSTQSALIQSTPVLMLAVEQLPAGISERPHLISVVKGGLSVGISKADEVMTVAFESTDPREAAEVANAVVRAYVTYQSNELHSTVAEVQRIIEKEKNQRDEDVNNKLKALSQFKHDNVGMSNETERSIVINRSIGALADKLTAGQIAVAEAEINYQAATAAASDPVTIRQFVAGLRLNNVIPANRAADEAWDMLRTLKQQKTALEAKLLPNHQTILDINARIGAIQPAKIEEETDQKAFHSYLASCAEALTLKKSLVARLQKSYDEQQKVAAQVSLEVAEYRRSEADLIADSQRAERLYEQADSRVKEISIGQDIGQAKVQVLEDAKPSFDPVRPQKLAVFGVAMGLGMVLGLSGIMLGDWMDQRLRSPEQVLANLTVPILGTVPHISSAKSISNAGREVLLDPMSTVAEGYRTIRTALYFGMHDERTKTILVTSPVAGEGKTTLVSNLAISMAQAGRRTLILDADFRKPMQHVVFGLKAEVGLSSVLASRATLSDAIQPTEIDRLDVLPCGPVPMNPSESLNSHGFAELLRELSDDYDCVLLDSAPIVPVTDARILAAICDLTVLVLRAERSTRKVSLEARNSLYSVGAEIAGIVLNDVSPWGAGYSHYVSAARRRRNGAIAEVTDEPVVERVSELSRARQIALAGATNNKTNGRKK